MVTLKTEPAGVRSMDQLLALALALEHQSATRYAELAAQAHSGGLADIAAVFDRLAQEERQHEAGVADWAKRRIGRSIAPAAPPAAGADTFDDEAAAELAASRLANPYRVLSMAVRNEERAFLFWTYIAAHAEADEIREAAERIALEELDHVALLRHARRSAYHEQRRGLPPRASRGVPIRLAEAAARERSLAAELRDLAERSQGDMREDAAALSAEATVTADRLEMLCGGAIGQTEDGEGRAARAEQLVEDYLEIADHSRDETIVATIQPMARQAILRLAWLRAVTDRNPSSQG